MLPRHEKKLAGRPRSRDSWDSQPRAGRQQRGPGLCKRTPSFCSAQHGSELGGLRWRNAISLFALYQTGPCHHFFRETAALWLPAATQRELRPGARGRQSQTAAPSWAAAPAPTELLQTSGAASAHQGARQRSPGRPAALRAEMLPGRAAAHHLPAHCLIPVVSSRWWQAGPSKGGLSTL